MAKEIMINEFEKHQNSDYNRMEAGGKRLIVLP